MSGIYTFNWGVFWAVLAALAAVYLAIARLRLAVPTRNLIEEHLVARIEGTLNGLAGKIEATESALDDICTLLEYRVGMSPEEAREVNLDARIARDDEAFRVTAKKKEGETKKETQP